MHRRDHVVGFYALMRKLENLVGGKRILGNASGRMSWPDRGVYFFFEPGEHRSETSQGFRVVRVGTHALQAKSRTSLWQRLRQHRGTLNPRGGNHRGSIFRLLVGNALINRDPAIGIYSWSDKASAPKHVRVAEQPVEALVSRYIGGMSVLFVPVEDAPGPDSQRGYVERNAIALLSGYSEAAIDLPSSSWLGLYCTRERVRRSGLWNNNHVDETYDPEFLSLFEELVKGMS